MIEKNNQINYSTDISCLMFSQGTFVTRAEDFEFICKIYGQRLLSPSTEQNFKV